MKFTRQFTKNNDDAYSGLEFKTTTSEIKNPDGTIVFSAPNIEVPLIIRKLRPISLHKNIFVKLAFLHM